MAGIKVNMVGKKKRKSVKGKKKGSSVKWHRPGAPFKPKDFGWRKGK